MEDILDNTSPSNESASRKYTSLLIAGESFAVDIDSVKEIVKYSEFVPLKEPFEGVEGFVELNSLRIPVLNIRKILSLNSPSTDIVIMIVNIEGYIVGLMVDIDADMEIFSSITSPKPLNAAHKLKKFIEGTINVSDKSINVLALSTLISEKCGARLFAGRGE